MGHHYNSRCLFNYSFPFFTDIFPSKYQEQIDVTGPFRRELFHSKFDVKLIPLPRQYTTLQL